MTDLSPENAPNLLKPQIPSFNSKRMSKLPVIVTLSFLAVTLGWIVHSSATKAQEQKLKRQTSESEKDQQYQITKAEPPKDIDPKRRIPAALGSKQAPNGYNPSLVDPASGFETELTKRSQDLYLKALGSGIIAKYSLEDEEKQQHQTTEFEMNKKPFSASMNSSNKSSSQKTKSASPYEVKMGAVIPAILISGINSDLPGQIIGQVSQNVYDSVNGDYLLIPQGSKLIGTYNSMLALGQERALLIWQRLLFPNGDSVDLGSMGGTDQGGYAGFKDQVNNHFMKIYGNAVLLSLVGAGFQMSQRNSNAQSTPEQIIAAQLGVNMGNLSNEILRKQIQIQPTIEIRPGYRFNVMVNRDMILEPYDFNESKDREIYE
jgi:type IV secretory pathway VirB10-like protein